MLKALEERHQQLKSLQNFPPAENLQHAETSQSTHNANQLTGCNKNAGPRPEETSEQTKVP